jgi:dihydrodipicolinate reductase
MAIAAMMTTAMAPAMSPYSMAVAPRLQVNAEAADVAIDFTDDVMVVLLFLADCPVTVVIQTTS